MNQYKLSILIDAVDEADALVQLADMIEARQDITGMFDIQGVWADAPERGTK